MPCRTAAPALAGLCGAAASGIDIYGSDTGRLTIGGSVAGSGNRIAFNRGVGLGWEVSAARSLVHSTSAATRSPSQRRRHCPGPHNTAPANDPYDADEGPNRLQNRPHRRSDAAFGGRTAARDLPRRTAVANATYRCASSSTPASMATEGTAVGSDDYTAIDAQAAKTVVLTLAPACVRYGGRRRHRCRGAFEPVFALAT